MAGRTATIALSVVVVACGSATTNLPTHKDWGSTLPLGVLTGVLTRDGDCVWLDADGGQGRFLVVWAPGTSRNGDAIVGSDGRIITAIDDGVVLQGAGYDASNIGTQVVDSLPEGCATDQYWGVAAVLRSNSGPTGTSH